MALTLRSTRVLLAIAFCGSLQAASLALSSGSAVQGSTASLSVSLASPTGGAPAGLQWTISYPANLVSSLSVTAGPAAVQAAKTLLCSSPASGSYTCVLYGINTSTIANGSVATVSVQASATVTLSITNVVATDASAKSLPTSATGGTLTVTAPVAAPAVTSLSCAAASLASAASTNCTVNLSMAAPSGGVSVAVGSSNSAVSVPSAVLIAAGSTSGAFTATAASLSSSQTAVVTASLNGGSGSDSILVLPPVGTFTPIRVNAGGSAYTDSLGQVWSADTGYLGGVTYAVPASIQGTSDPALYQTLRYSAQQYQFSVPAGSYNVKLKFAETYYGSPGKRVFNVALNSTTVLQSFDPVAAAGASFTAVDRSFPVNSSGQILIQFSPLIDNPILNAIEITSATAPQTGAFALRVNAGGPNDTDSLGQAWKADTGFTGGNTYAVSTPINGTSDASLYQSQRYGAVQYQFSVPAGTYNVKLKFAELYFRSAGQRVFNVLLNGTTVLQNFDPAAAAGASFTAVRPHLFRLLERTDCHPTQCCRG